MLGSGFGVHVCKQAAFVPQQGGVVDADCASDRRVRSGTIHPGTEDGRWHVCVCLLVDVGMHVCMLCMHVCMCMYVECGGCVRCVCRCVCMCVMWGTV